MPIALYDAPYVRKHASTERTSDPPNRNTKARTNNRCDVTVELAIPRLTYNLTSFDDTHSYVGPPRTKLRSSTEPTFIRVNKRFSVIHVFIA